MSSFGFIKVFTEEREEFGAGSEYSEGTAVAHAWFGVLVGYCRSWEVVMWD
jgi:hypothetical protein